MGVRTARIAGEGEWTHLFVDNYIYLDTGFRASLEHTVEPPFLVEVWRAAEKLHDVSQGPRRRVWRRETCEFGGEPPISNVDDLSGIIQRYRDCLFYVQRVLGVFVHGNRTYPKIVPSVHIPLCAVSAPHVGETRITMRVPDEVAPLVDALLVWLVVAVVRIEDVLVLADLVLQVY